MSDKVISWLARTGFRPSWAALIRIAAWFVVGIVALNALLPDRSPDLAADNYNVAAPDPWVRSITAARGDHRAFTPTANDDVFKIAWIGGSEIQSIGTGIYTFLPIEVRKQLPTVDDRPVSIDMYFVSGMRLADEYAAVLAAIHDEVDAIVISLNPVWVLNDLAVQGWSNFNSGLAVRTLTSVGAWPVSASLVSPSDLVWGLASRMHIVDDRYQWGTDVQEAADRLTVMGESSSATANSTDTAAATPGGLDRIRQMTIPVEFWSLYAPTVAPSEPLAVRQAALFERSATSESGINEDLLDLIGNAVTGSGIPTLVYTAAVSDEVLDDPNIAVHLETIEERLAAHAPSFAAGYVTYDPHTIARRVTGMQFNDVVHVADLGPLAGAMAWDLCGLLTMTDHRPECGTP